MRREKEARMVPFTETDFQKKRSYFKGKYDMLVEQPKEARRYLKSWA